MSIVPVKNLKGLFLYFALAVIVSIISNLAIIFALVLELVVANLTNLVSMYAFVFLPPVIVFSAAVILIQSAFSKYSAKSSAKLDWQPNKARSWAIYIAFLFFSYVFSFGLFYIIHEYFALESVILSPERTKILLIVLIANAALFCPLESRDAVTKDRDGVKST